MIEDNIESEFVSWESLELKNVWLRTLISSDYHWRFEIRFMEVAGSWWPWHSTLFCYQDMLVNTISSIELVEYDPELMIVIV